jgi:hypothetical protein
LLCTDNNQFKADANGWTLFDGAFQGDHAPDENYVAIEPVTFRLEEVEIYFTRRTLMAQAKLKICRSFGLRPHDEDCSVSFNTLRDEDVYGERGPRDLSPAREPNAVKEVSF